MKYCPRCRDSVQEDARFCSNCRYNLTGPPQRLSEPAPSYEYEAEPQRQGGGMSWGEAFSRVFGGILSLIVFYILVAILTGVAGYLIFDDDNLIGGIVVAVIGLLIFILAIYAVALKVLTDAIADHVERRISRRLTSPRPQSVAPPR